MSNSCLTVCAACNASRAGSLGIRHCSEVNLSLISFNHQNGLVHAVYLYALTPQAVTMHTHLSHPPPDSHQSIMDNLSDTLVNAFSKVRKPDERFLEMQDEIEKYEEGLAAIEKLAGRGKGRLDGGCYAVHGTEY